MKPTIDSDSVNMEYIREMSQTCFGSTHAWKRSINVTMWNLAELTSCYFSSKRWQMRQPNFYNFVNYLISKRYNKPAHYNWLLLQSWCAANCGIFAKIRIILDILESWIKTSYAILERILLIIIKHPIHRINGYVLQKKMHQSPQMKKKTLAFSVAALRVASLVKPDYVQFRGWE